MTEAIDEMARRRDVGAAREAAASPRRRRQRATTLGLLVALPILSILLVPLLTGEPIRSLLARKLPPEVARSLAQQMLETAVADVSAFRADYDELPRTLWEVGMPPQGTWHYETGPDGRTFRIEGTLQGQRVSFDSGR